MVGGISRTVERDGWRFDIGGHRFFTKVPRVEDFWHEILPDEDFLLRPRMSRIYYRGKFYDYPLKAVNALRNLGLLEAVRCVRLVRLGPGAPAEGPDTLRGLGRRPASAGGCTDLLQDLHREGLGRAGRPRCRPTGRRSGSRTCRWPRRCSTPCCRGATRRTSPASSRSSSTRSYGPGMMWERCADRVRDRGGEVTMRHRVSRVHRDPQRRRATGGDRRRRQTARAGNRPTTSISSMPISELVRAMDPPAPAEVRAAADDLRYRDFLTVALVVPAEFSASRTTGSTSTTPGCGSGGSRTSAPGRRTWSRTGAPASGWSTSSSRATTCGTCPTTTWSRWRPRSWSSSAWSGPACVEAGLRGADAEGVPGLRRALPAQRRGDPARGSPRQVPERAPGRAQRHAPVQQPGPLDATPPC